MSAITTRSLRLACDLGRLDAALDPRTNLPPAALRGADLLLQLAAFRDGAIVDDVSNYDTLTAVVRALNADGTLGAVQFSTAIAGAALGACTEVDWKAGTDQHAEIALNGDNLNLGAGRYKLAIYGITTAGVLVPWAHVALTVVDAGFVDGTPPTPSSDYYTKAQADAAFLRALPTDGAFRLSGDGLFIQLKDSATLKWRSIWLAAGALQMGPEEV